MSLRTRTLRLVLLAGVGWLLMTPPLIPSAPGLVFGYPITALYLLIVWLALLLSARWVLLAAPDEDG